MVAGADARITGAGDGDWWRDEWMAAGSRSVESDDAMRAWKVVKLSRPLTNEPLMKTVGAMAGMRRKRVKATCMFGPMSAEGRLGESLWRWVWKR